MLTRPIPAQPLPIKPVTSISCAPSALFTDLSYVEGSTVSLCLSCVPSSIDTLDEEYDLPANRFTIRQPRAPGSMLESKGDVRMDLGCHNGDTATPLLTTPHKNIDVNKYFNNIHIQSIEDELKQQCEDKTCDVMVFFSAP
ncbi:hypothetical protein PAXRUDRAFT_145344 [Paxillus rubicundulus Ve08.2h10]|uniref:Uncharacterized protein n=1 Tax=Paxillus rubicundulus Ve08.2h10 TaxID=930991 RepID=A0A0D0DV71_9AGAM|nr:hypothetical protein PAXRUDRAFT_145344 [Paxillus rubicundulus Ve08.2h10]